MNLSSVKRPKVQKLWLTPIIDMFVTIMIFLLISFSPEATKLKKSKQVTLPKAASLEATLPSIQLEVSVEGIRVNGVKIEGLDPSSHRSQDWLPLKTRIEQIRKTPGENILLIADRKTSYKFIDKTIAHLASYGHSQIQLLTQKVK